MAATTPNEAKISLKLMVHKEKKRVIFAEADNHFVDILFSFMALPLGTIVRLLEKIPDQKVKALGSLQTFTDDLRVMPNNPSFSIKLLCDAGVTDASQLEERTFDVVHDQVTSLATSTQRMDLVIAYG
ncbi:GRAM domain family protein [Tanacetum coccineum]